jgi:hypothetical protein
MCDVLDVPHLRASNTYGGVVHLYGEECNGETAPQELIDMVGLNESNGSFHDGGPMFKPAVKYSVAQSVTSLASLNDDYPVSPQRIGKMLSEMLMGGKGTPWKEINP